MGDGDAVPNNCKHKSSINDLRNPSILYKSAVSDRLVTGNLQAYMRMNKVAMRAVNKSKRSKIKKLSRNLLMRVGGPIFSRFRGG